MHGRGDQTPASAAAPIPVFETWSLLWAFRLLEEKSDRWLPWNVLDSSLVVCAVLVVLLLRARPVLFIAMLALEAVDIVLDLPHVLNHQWLVLAINSLLLVRLVPIAAARWPEHGRDAWEALSVRLLGLRPFLLTAMGVMYGAAGFHKLNSGFFDPRTSCFGQLYDYLGFLLPLPENPSTTVVVFGAALTVVVELFLCAAFLSRRLLGAAICLALVFHLILGVRYPSFSTFVMTVLFMILPESLLRRICGDTPPGSRSFAAPATAAALVVFAAVFWYLPAAWPGMAPQNRHLLPRAAWSILAVTVVGSLLWTFRKLLVARTGSWVKGRLTAGQGVVCCLLGFNAACPYLGLKTGTSFSMYSNLVTERWTNHLLLSDRVFNAISSGQTWVTLQERSHSLRSGEDVPGRVLPRRLLAIWVHQAHAAGARDIRLTYLEQGREVVVEHAERDPRLQVEPNLWDTHLALFRPVRQGAEDRCQW
jgi:hypothetical protein